MSFTLFSSVPRKPPTQQATGKRPPLAQTEEFTLLDFQQNALPQAIDLLASGKSCQCIAATGLGKTYYLAQLLYTLRTKHADRYPVDKPILIITRKSLVVQTCRVLGERGVPNVTVISINQLRSTLGLMFLEWKTRMVNNEPSIWPVWIKEHMPCLLVVDESQMLKNMESAQSKVVRSWNIGWNGPAFFLSATPYSRPIHTRAIAVALGVCTDDQFPGWIAAACKDPYAWSPAAMKRIQLTLEPRTIRFVGAHYKHVTRIHQLIIPLPESKRRAYQEAFEEYQEARMKKLLNPLAGMAELLVAIAKFREKSEVLRADELAELALRDSSEGKNVILAFSFQETLKVVREILVNVHGVAPEHVGIIIGGQNDVERQRNIDNFQSERTHIMLLMFQAGGAGLSLHNTSKNKRARTVYLPPVWGAEELVQVLGRAHRINSVSTTHQYILWYGGTIEERVAQKVKLKCSALKEVVGKSETWVKEFDRLAVEAGQATRSTQQTTLLLEEEDSVECIDITATRQAVTYSEDEDMPSDEGLDVDIEIPVENTEVEHLQLTISKQDQQIPNDSCML